MKFIAHFSYFYGDIIIRLTRCDPATGLYTKCWIIILKATDQNSRSALEVDDLIVGVKTQLTFTLDNVLCLNGLYQLFVVQYSMICM